MYIRNLSGIYSPNGSTISISSLNQYSIINPPASLIVTSTPPAAVSCSVILNPQPSALTTPDIIDALETIASQINDTIFNIDQDVLLTDQLFRALESDTTLLQNSFNLNSFYDIIKLSNTGVLYDIERALATDSIQNANDMNNNVLPDNQIEESYKLYYEAYSNYLSGSLNEQDSINIITLAQGCPTIHGNSVYLSEALFNYIYFQDTTFTQFCPENIEKSSLSIESIDEFSYFSIYPVPNKGEFSVNGPFKEGYHIKIISMDSKVLYFEELLNNTDLVEVRQQLSPGAYFLIIKDENQNHIFSNKFIVIH